MSLFRLAAALLFGISVGCAFGWWFHATTTTDLGLGLAGLFFYVLAGYEPTLPALPPRRAEQ